MLFSASQAWERKKNEKGGKACEIVSYLIKYVNQKMIQIIKSEKISWLASIIGLIHKRGGDIKYIFICTISDQRIKGTRLKTI